MSSPAAEGVKSTDAPPTRDMEGEEGPRNGTRVFAVAAAAAAAGGSDTQAAPTCPICMEAWTCDGAHRICCIIPCGHVYGRSCMERWLHHCGSTRAKCPQCGIHFGLKHLINSLHQEICGVVAVVFRTRPHMSLANMMVFMKSPLKVMKVKAHCESQIKQMTVEFKRQLAEKDAEMKASEAIRELETFKANSALSDIRMRCRILRMEKAVIDHVAMVNMLKSQMKEMVEKNATPMDLMEFVEAALPCSNLSIPESLMADG